MISIRNAKPSDVLVIEKIQCSCYSEFYWESREVLLDKITRGSGLCYVAVKNEEVIGYLLAYSWTSIKTPPALHCLKAEEGEVVKNHVHIHDLAVKPSERKAGVGRKLVNSLFTSLPENTTFGAVAVESAIKFWKSFGFQEYKDIDIAYKATYGESSVFLYRVYSINCLQFF